MTKRKILAIDDSLALRVFITKTLGQVEEFELLTAADATEGIAAARAHLPDLILLDFVLPDMKGDAVCAKLAKDGPTAAIPILMMSSNVGDIKRVEKEHQNVIGSVAKPFTPDSLLATVREIVLVVPRANRPVQEGAPEPVFDVAPRLVFSHRSDLLPLANAIRCVGDARLTGCLSIFERNLAVECLFRDGQLSVLTTRDVDEYLASSTFAFERLPAELLQTARVVQQETGCPLFITLARSAAFEQRHLSQALNDHGTRLLARMLSSRKAEYEFHELSKLPAYLTDLPDAECVDSFLLSSVRVLEQEVLPAAHERAVPIYTRGGYDRIQRVGLVREETEILSRMGTRTVEDIASECGLRADAVSQVLSRFRILEILEYWPSDLVRG